MPLNSQDDRLGGRVVRVTETALADYSYVSQSTCCAEWDCWRAPMWSPGGTGESITSRPRFQSASSSGFRRSSIRLHRWLCLRSCATPDARNTAPSSSGVLPRNGSGRAAVPCLRAPRRPRIPSGGRREREAGHSRWNEPASRKPNRKFRDDTYELPPFPAGITLSWRLIRPRSLMLSASPLRS
jgi:hypothetical protein